MTNMPAVFLDLQGTLGGDGLGDIREFAFYPRAVPALRLLGENGFRSIVVTNQSRIGKGVFSYDQYEARVAELRWELTDAETRWDAIYCCPHRSIDDCACQKPKLGMLNAARQEFDLTLSDCYVVGDMGSDIVMAQAAGCQGILVRTGAGESSLAGYRHTWASVESDFVADDVLKAVRWIIRHRSRGVSKQIALDRSREK